MTLPSRLLERLARRPHLARIARNVAWLSIDQLLRMGVGLAVGVWMARYLGPEQFGSLAYAIAFVGVFAAVGTLGLQPVVVRELVRDRSAAGAILASAFALQLSAGVLALLLALLANAWLGSDDALMRTSVILLSLALPFRASDTVRYWFESQVESRYVVWVENGVFLLVSAARVGLILLEASLIAFVVAAMVETILVGSGLLIAYTMRAGPPSWRSVGRLRMRSLLQGSWPFLLAGLSVTLYMRMDVVMLKQMANSYEVGVYSVAVRITELLYVLPTIFVASASPAIIESHQASRPMYLARMRQLYAAGFWFAAAVSLALVIFAQPVIDITFGRNYSDAAAVLAIYVWGSIAVVHGIISSQHLLVENLPRISLYRTLIGLGCNFALNTWLIPLYGARGAAAATVVSYFVATYALLLFGATRTHAMFMIASCFRIRMEARGAAL
ncbi:MAG: flippase [Pseudomonadota bacterium]